MAMIRKLAAIAGAAEAARRYAKKNPDKTSKYLDQAAQFVDKQTKGKYSGQIDGVTRRPRAWRASTPRAPPELPGTALPLPAALSQRPDRQVNPATPSPERRPSA